MSQHRVASPVPACEWAADLMALAARADAMERKPAAPLADRLALATAAFSQLWLGWSPATIARSCRASARLIEPVLVVAGSLDEQLEANRVIREAALTAAHLLTQPAEIAPVVPIDHERRKGSKGAPKGNQNAEKQRPQSGAIEKSRVRDQVAAETGTSKNTDQAFEQLAPQGFHGVGDEPAPAPANTTDWHTAHEAADLLNVSSATVHRWRLAGQLGQEGADWQPHGRTFLHRAVVVDAVRTARAVPREPARRRRPTAADNHPPGWLRPDDVARLLGISGDSVRRMICAGRIPAEMIFAAGPRSRWIDPAAVELLTSKKPPGRASQRLDNTGGTSQNSQ